LVLSNILDFLLGMFSADGGRTSCSTAWPLHTGGKILAEIEAMLSF
jgi:hypothetical protein